MQTDVAVTLAPVCSSMTSVNSGTARRSLSQPLGRTSYKSVKYSNKMANRVVLLLWLIQALGLVFILEQPQGSWLQSMPRFKEFVKHHRLKRKRILMKDLWPFFSQGDL